MPSPDIGSAAAARPCHNQLSLADALDRILHRGVSMEGNLTIGLADVDLLFLDLRLLLGAVDTIWPEGAPPVAAVYPRTPASPSPASQTPPPALREIGSHPVAHASGDSGLPRALDQQRSANTSSPAQGLVRLVLTVVKLLHKVLERQAVRRMESGRLTDTQIENVGTALFAQAEEILRLQQQFGFSDKDLSLELGVPDGAL
jgi:hypothetical protein